MLEMLAMGGSRNAVSLANSIRFAREMAGQTRHDQNTPPLPASRPHRTTTTSDSGRRRVAGRGSPECLLLPAPLTALPPEPVREFRLEMGRGSRVFEEPVTCWGESTDRRSSSAEQCLTLPLFTPPRAMRP